MSCKVRRMHGGPIREIIKAVLPMSDWWVSDLLDGRTGTIARVFIQGNQDWPNSRSDVVTHSEFSNERLAKLMIDGWC